MNLPIRKVEEHFTFPFKLHNYQYKTVEKIVEFDRVLLTDGVGVGKSAMSLYTALYSSLAHDVEQILILVPPALIDQTEEWVNSVKGIGDCLVFRGSPAQRKEMDLSASPVVIMSYNIFRSDFDRVKKMGEKHKLFIIADELSLKSMRQTYKKLKLLLYRKQRFDPHNDNPFHRICALNATPISDRSQIYNWAAIFAPWCYHSLALFKLAHAGAVDNWGNVLNWVNTDVMDNNYDSFAMASEDVDIEIPESVFIEMPYSLEKKHLNLYADIAEAQFLLLPDKLIEQAVDALFSTLQRVVLTPKEFGLDIRPPILDIIDQRLDQMMEDDRVIIYTRHVSVSKMLHEYYKGSVAVFGAIPGKEKRDNLLRFKAGDAQVMIANLDSLSKGQNLQVANHTIYAELPFRSDILIQANGRTARQGQDRSTFFHFPIAKGTIQRQIYQRLLANDADLLKFNRSKAALRDFVRKAK